jgi:hypothetical protein
LAAAFLLTAQAAVACPVCFDAEEEARLAYQIGAAAMTFLPLTLMGGAALFLRRRMKQRDLEASLPELD